MRKALVAVLTLIICLVAGLEFTGHLLAQVATGTILGTVQDSTGLVVPGAQVTVTDTGKGLSTSCQLQRLDRGRHRQQRIHFQYRDRYAHPRVRARIQGGDRYLLG
jgi:hypothetical protein